MRCDATRSRTGSGSSAPAPATSRGPASTWRSGTSADAPAASRSGACSAALQEPTATYFYYLARGSRREPRRRRSPTGSRTDSRSSTSRSGSTTRRISRMVAALREALGAGPRLRLDANGSWTLPQAVRMLRALEEYDIDFVEQPVRDHPIGHLAELRNRTAISRLRERRALVGGRRVRAHPCARRPTSSASRRTGSVRIARLLDGSRGSPSTKACRSASTPTASSGSPPPPRITWC